MVKDCYNCEHHTWGDEWWNCKTECLKCKYTDRQGEKVPSNWKSLPMTNADRIRAMSDEELAEFLEGDFGNMMVGFALRWLKQPAEVE